MIDEHKLPFFCYDQRYGLSLEDDSTPDAQALINELAGWFREQPGSLGSEFAMRISGRFFNRVLAAGQGPSSIGCARDRNGRATMPPGSNAEPEVGILFPTRTERNLAHVFQEKRQENFRRFLQAIAGEQPREIERYASSLQKASGPVRYQAWVRLRGQRGALWTEPSNLEALANYNTHYQSAPDRIELIDRVGIMLDRGQAPVPDDTALVLSRTEPRRRVLGFELLRERGVKLTGAGRLLVMPRESHPYLEMSEQRAGWLFVEGWRLLFH